MQYIEMCKDQIYENAANNGMLAGGLVFVALSILYWLLPIPKGPLWTGGIMTGICCVTWACGAIVDSISLSQKTTKGFGTPVDYIEKTQAMYNYPHKNIANEWVGASDRYWRKYPTQLAKILYIPIFVAAGISLFLLGFSSPASWFSGPPKVSGIEAKFDTGVIRHDLQLKNLSSNDLADVNMTVTLYREDGQKVNIPQSWRQWGVRESKQIDVPAHRYLRVTLQGTANQNSQLKKIDCDWDFTWK